MTEPAVLIYTKRDCSFCAGAKRLLAAREIPFAEVDLTTDLERQRELGIMSLPAIFVRGVLLGGFDALRALDAAGGLHARLAEPLAS